MPVITKITRQKRNEERYNIFLDGVYAFSVDEAVLVQYQLQKNKELTDFDIGEIEYEDEVRKGFNKALVYLSYRMRSEKEIEDHLKEQEMGDAAISETLHKLRHYGYVNDQSFAQAYYNTQINTTDKGPIQIKNGLREKGVSNDIIESIISETPEEEWNDRAIGIMEKVVKKNQKLSPLQIKKKTQDTLSRKGYSGQTVAFVLANLTIERDEEDQKAAVLTQAKKAHNKYSRKFEGFEYEQKMKQTLYRKGFSMDEIEWAIGELNDNEDMD
ncbi:recombination regulator RecX [Jeotgalibacillus sp. R-1-5s-1]|uniref:recombination regulator RecX n=1 Tax=Jeotgalibacillus sp. R-1-5s-1 TaxID=2555897 RepID=UPI00106B2A48|nr:recombination regulator RecX [Jeotgalibacillus sp. R-1-5s-1]TFE01241.1 recombination regulator RecX [Jeotgalibacillus sp. R-1-5s-1]